MIEINEFKNGQSVEIPTMDSLLRLEEGYEYVDHTADVQLHAWGPDLSRAFVNCAGAMFAYITDLSKVEPIHSNELSISADDLEGLLFHFLDELLFYFSCEYFIPREITIQEMDLKNFQIKVQIKGEDFDLSKHTQGTEVKAITYSNLQIHQSQNSCDVFVIVDI